METEQRCAPTQGSRHGKEVQLVELGAGGGWEHERSTTRRLAQGRREGWMGEKVGGSQVRRLPGHYMLGDGNPCKHAHGSWSMGGRSDFISTTQLTREYGPTNDEECNQILWGHVTASRSQFGLVA
ncbi:hypothetical protein Zm00014a_005608 [Zea mays]|uniref:Uncharacterized protein n=1 Tax=Zea mays TaxID=4577 RepID=A0A3L6DDE7_MAIZE|nr:hypothetical protein Zm00014a_005608 [Zea mays]